MEHGPSFFDRVTFDPKLRDTFVGRYFGSIRTIILIILTLSGAGLVTFLSLPRELNPSIKIPIVFVATVYPGAAPEDIESLVSQPLEDAVSGLSGVTLVSSTSQEGSSTLSIEFVSGTDPDKAKADVQNAIDSVNDLPEDADDPRVQVLDFENQPVINFLVSGPGDPASLGSFADTLKERIGDLPSVESVSLGYRKDPEISIILEPQKIATLGLDIPSVSRSAVGALSSSPAGSLSGTGTSFALSQEKSLTDLSDLRQLPLEVSGRVVALGDVARVEERASANAREAFVSYQGDAPTRAITFSVFKTDEADAGETVTALRQAFADLNAEQGSQFTFEAIFDGAKEIQKSFDQLFHDFLLTIGLVFLVLILFFGLRQSVVASLAIPLTFLVTFLVMGATGITINFIALFSLLLALGILVDNAIVIISAMASYERTERFTPEESALLVWRDFRSVIFTTTITTVWAFVPLLLASGIIGDFIRPIPVVVSSALAISAAIALFIVIPMMAMLQTGNFPRRVKLFFILLIFLAGAALLFVLIPAGPYRLPCFLLSLILLPLLAWSARAIRERERAAHGSRFNRIQASLRRIADQGFFDFHPLALRYQRFIKETLTQKKARRTTLAMLILFALFSYALVPTGYVVNEFFPEDDQEILYVTLELPQGTPLATARAEAENLLATFRQTEESRYVLAEVGAGLTEGVSSSRELSNVLLTIALTPKGDRAITSGELVAKLNRQYEDYPAGKLSVSQLAGGPPAGSDLQIKLLGEDRTLLNQYADQIVTRLEETPGVSNITKSIQTGSSKIVFVPDTVEMERLGVDRATTAFFLRTLGSGFTVKENARFGQDGNTEERDIVVRFADTDVSSNPDSLASLLIPTNEGEKPLSALGSFRLEPNPTLITREDGKRTLSVSAAVEDGYSPSTLSAELGRYADSLDLPTGYSWKTGGANEENEKSVQSILKAMLLAAALIFSTMVIQFNSFRKALIVLLTVPLAVSGVFIIFALTGTPLSFPALIGVLALFGIVVNNSIILVDKINRNMDAGLPLDQAIAEGAASRLEPILLTALTTIIGLIPITLSDPIWQGLGGAIIAGLLFSGIAKLFFIPVMYKVFYGQGESEKPAA